MLIGPMPNVDILTLVVAVAVSLPSSTLATTFQVTGRRHLLDGELAVEREVVPACPRRSSPACPMSFETVRYASG